MDLKDFYEGKAFDAYTYFGAHVEENGTLFRVYAPNARHVALIGTFNNWQEREMCRENGGIYSCYIEEAKEGMLYKYRIYQQDGGIVDHSDPYGFEMELRPDSASVIASLNTYHFEDEEWLSEREEVKGYYDKPLNIYEVHMGSWHTKSEKANDFYTYDEIAPKLIAYVKKEGYNFIEFLPLSEHPADCSWGYQITGFYSPTSRYGDSKGLKKLVDLCHKSGIGVIMDFVPVHFAMDYYGLAKFDGTTLYEYANEDVGKSEWGSMNFIYAKGEVCSFLQSAANYWLQEFHFDGLRMDAISNALYWQGDVRRGINTCAVNFIRQMNEGLHQLNKGAILIAEDSSAYPKVTAPVQYDGLGFDYKWDMGWMNDTLDYFRSAPEYRSKAYHKLTFSMMYFYNELYLLPFSHDEVVHGKATIIQKMWGLYDDKFKQCKVLYTYMYTHPGKKLNFMGNEIGQFREWDETREQDWDMLKYPKHDSFHEYIIALNKLYLKKEAFYVGEYNSNCFRWLEVNAEKECVYIYERKSQNDAFITILNLSNVTYDAFRFGYDYKVKIKEVLNSDYNRFGGETKEEPYQVEMEKVAYKEWPYSIEVKLVPFSARIFEVQLKEPRTQN